MGKAAWMGGAKGAGPPRVNVPPAVQSTPLERDTLHSIQVRPHSAGLKPWIVMPAMPLLRTAANVVKLFAQKMGIAISYYPPHRAVLSAS